MEQKITFRFTKEELDNLLYSLNAASVHAHDMELYDWAYQFNSLWLRLYDLSKCIK